MFECRVIDRHSPVLGDGVADAVQDLADGRTGGLPDPDHDEPAFERRVRRHDAPVLVVGRRPDDREIAPRQDGLQQGGDIARPLASTGGYHRMALVDEQDRAHGACLGDHRRDALLELPVVAAVAEQCGHVERDDPPPGEQRRDVAGGDPACEALDDR